MTVNYEEKTFETYFNTEMTRKYDPVFFPPGQVQENILGFDNSFYLPFTTSFWAYFGFDKIYSVFYLNELEEYLFERINSLPNIKINLMLQYKRPEYLTLSTAKEWQSWNQPYFRYAVESEQQRVLMKISDYCNGNVVALYAAPAVKNRDELLRFAINSVIINNTNLKYAHDLNDHRRNTYANSGSYSIAFSEPEKIENVDLSHVINKYSSKYNSDKKVISHNKNSNVASIIQFASIVEEINENKLTNFHIKRNKTLSEYKLLYSLEFMRLFKFYNNIQWALIL